MTVFKTFLKILNKCKMPIIMYTVILIFFAIFNMQSENNQISFEQEKPDILIINKDEKKGLTKNLIDYIEKNSNIINIKENEDAINDALFYRDVNYIIYIPENYREDFLNQKNPNLEVKSTKDYQASLAEMMLERYLKFANIYNQTAESEEELIKFLDSTLEKETKVELTSKIDTENLGNAGFYYNFMNYCILAGAIYVICLILSSFKKETVNKRTIISSMNYKKYNRYLLLSNGLFALFTWVFYVILSFFLVGDVMFTSHGMLYILNSFVFNICALTIAFLIGNLLTNKEAINGIINVIALGSSFLCGAFVPMEYLPNQVLNIAHILPSYWYIKTNELIKGIEVCNFENIRPLLLNMGIILCFALLFILITNIISNRKRKLG